MANLSVREYEHLTACANGLIPVGQEECVANYDIAITGGSSQGQVFHVRTKFVRVNCDVACRVDIGPNPNAGTRGCRLSAEQTEYFGVVQGASFRVAVISSL